jgi:hypothetical protein
VITYTFRDEPLTILNAKKADPQKIGQALAKITEAAGGRLTPAAVVDAAKDRRSVLHRHFLWDDAKAGELYRLDQARELVRVIRVEDEDREPTRAFLSIRDDAGTSYRTAGEVAGSLDLQLMVLKQAERDLEAWTKRYREISDACADVTAAREKVRSKRQALEARA